MNRPLMMVGILAGLMAGGLSGCTDPIPANQDQFGQPLQVSMTDYWLQGQLAVTVLQPMRVGEGQSKVIIQVRNKYDSTANVDYKYYFVDERGAQVDSPSGWQLVTIPPRGTQQFEFASMSAAARDFRVQLRKAQ